MSNMEAIIKNGGIVGLWFHSWDKGKPHGHGQIIGRCDSGGYECAIYDYEHGGVVDVVIMTPDELIWCPFFLDAWSMRQHCERMNGGDA